MPDYMRFSIRILTLLFDAWSYPIKGKPFHRLPLSQRIDQVAAWENSRLELRHGLIVFYRSFETFGLYSILYWQDYRSVTRWLGKECVHTTNAWWSPYH